MLRLIVFLTFMSYVGTFSYMTYNVQQITETAVPYPLYMFHILAIVLVGYVLYKGEDLIK